MKTGWPRHPHDLNDRINEDNKVLVETQFSNKLKFDWPEIYYSRLAKLIDSIDIPRDLYDWDVHAPSAPTRVTLSNEPNWLDFDDDVDFQAAMENSELEASEKLQTRLDRLSKAIARHCEWALDDEHSNKLLK